ncbi:hypothetical protein ES708_20337 [subsurface metagenome]
MGGGGEGDSFHQLFDALAGDGYRGYDRHAQALAQPVDINIYAQVLGVVPDVEGDDDGDALFQ